MEREINRETEMSQKVAESESKHNKNEKEKYEEEKENENETKIKVKVKEDDNNKVDMEKQRNHLSFQALGHNGLPPLSPPLSLPASSPSSLPLPLQSTLSGTIIQNSQNHSIHERITHMEIIQHALPTIIYSDHRIHPPALPPLASFHSSALHLPQVILPLSSSYSDPSVSSSPPPSSSSSVSSFFSSFSSLFFDFTSRFNRLRSGLLSVAAFLKWMQWMTGRVVGSIGVGGSAADVASTVIERTGSFSDLSHSLISPAARHIPTSPSLFRSFRFFLTFFSRFSLRFHRFLRPYILLFLRSKSIHRILPLSALHFLSVGGMIKIILIGFSQFIIMWTGMVIMIRKYGKIMRKNIILPNIGSGQAGGEGNSQGSGEGTGGVEFKYPFLLFINAFKDSFAAFQNKFKSSSFLIKTFFISGFFVFVFCLFTVVKIIKEHWRRRDKLRIERESREQEEEQRRRLLSIDRSSLGLPLSSSSVSSLSLSFPSTFPIDLNHDDLSTPQYSPDTSPSGTPKHGMSRAGSSASLMVERKGKEGTYSNRSHLVSSSSRDLVPDRSSSLLPLSSPSPALSVSFISPSTFRHTQIQMSRIQSSSNGSNQKPAIDDEGEEKESLVNGSDESEETNTLPPPSGDCWSVTDSTSAHASACSSSSGATSSSSPSLSSPSQTSLLISFATSDSLHFLGGALSSTTSSSQLYQWLEALNKPTHHIVVAHIRVSTTVDVSHSPMMPVGLLWFSEDGFAGGVTLQGLHVVPNAKGKGIERALLSAFQDVTSTSASAPSGGWFAISHSDDVTAALRDFGYTQIGALPIVGDTINKQPQLIFWRQK
jgi:hypothetical protein